MSKVFCTNCAVALALPASIDVLKLDMAINLAKVLSADAKTSKEALAIAKTELENAVENMRAKPENNEILHGMLCFIRNNVDVEKDSVEIKGNIYKGSAVRIDKSEVSTATFNALKDKFEEALTLLQKADATKENIDKAAGELKAAYDNLALNSGVSKIKPELNNSNALEGAINNIEEVDDNRCNHLRSLRAKTLNDVNAIFMKSEELKAAPGNVFVLKMMKVIHDRLSGHHVKPLFMDLLTTRFIPLDNEGNPILTTEQCAIPYYEPWRNVLRHIASPARSLNEARQGIFVWIGEWR